VFGAATGDRGRRCTRRGRRSTPALNDLDWIMARTPFDEIVIAQETLSASQLAVLESFAASHRIALRRFWLGVTDLSPPAISDQELTTASAR
jgi:hypothetical protein